MSSMENHKYGPTAKAKYKRKQIWPTEIHAGAGAEMGDVTGTGNRGVDRGAALQDGVHL
ncbi:hypothetical protein JHN63_03895 [Streptomyces sp. MBT65]|uniref:hypothetical protein n=1 Tax=Streptomyces sp. MBT65 TaxID=1488395 RepID=UPI00190E03A3|nr:hypothetical protein [Streptomyces sp. MBT65]MBK3572979.1 hypothetical protein [Streptomyces sp. MBT65]